MPEHRTAPAMEARRLRTANATRARREAFIQRQIDRAARLLRDNGWTVTPPADKEGQ